MDIAEKRNLCQRGDNLKTASADVAVEINLLPQVRTSTSMLLGMTLCKRRKRMKYVTSISGNVVIFAIVNISKISL